MFQEHYTPNGKAVTDRSKVGCYFREANNPPKHRLHLTALTDFKFELSPGAKEHAAAVTRPTQRGMLIYNITPHEHLRGHAGTHFEYTARAED